MEEEGEVERDLQPVTWRRRKLGKRAEGVRERTFYSIEAGEGAVAYRATIMLYCTMRMFHDDASGMWSCSEPKYDAAPLRMLCTPTKCELGCATWAPGSHNTI